MKQSFLNEIKIWWHNLTHLHRRGSYKRNGINQTIFCFDCNYGEDKNSIYAKKMWEEIK